MFKYVLQCLVGTLTLLVSTCIAWYEGSTISNNSLEWGYSTPFTKLFNMEITNGHDISQLDYFVYATKFHPLFPAIMIASGFYLLSIVGYLLIKSRSKWALAFCGFISCMMLLLSGFIINSSTIGGRVLLWVTLGCGLVGLAVTVFVCLRKLKHQLSVEL